MKIDPTRVRASEFCDVIECPLGSRVRKMIRKGDLPAKKYTIGAIKLVGINKKLKFIQISEGTFVVVPKILSSKFSFVLGIVGLKI